jgi:hypothetical protein
MPFFDPEIVAVSDMAIEGLEARCYTSLAVPSAMNGRVN